MSRTRKFLGAFALSLLASAAVVGSVAAQDAPAAQADHSGARAFFKSLSPEQKMMLFVQMHNDTANMTDDQKHAYREQQHAKFAAMTDTDRAKLASDLQSKWNALPDDQKAQIKQQVAEYRAQRMGHMQGGSGGQ